MSLNAVENIVALAGHSGRHHKNYHQYVLDRLQTAVAGLEGDQYRQALQTALKQLREELIANPDMIRGKLPPK